jgi:tetratricopeptide (TPR) repeat protein
MRLAESFHQSQNYEAEIQVLQALIALQPQDAPTAYRLGLLLAAVQPDQALPVLQKAAQLDSAYRDAALAIGAAVQLASSAQEPAYTALMVGRALASSGEWELAAESFRRAVQARPDYAEAWAYLGEARQHLPSPSSTPGSVANQGLSELETALKLDPDSISTNTFLAFYWERQEQTDKAMPYLQTAVASDPQNPALQVELGNLFVLQGDLPSAQAAYQKAIDLSPNNPVYWRILAEFALKNDIQLRELALPAARQAVTLAPDDPIGLDLLGQVFFMLSDQDSAQRFLLRALSENPQYLPAHLHLGMSYLMQGNLEDGRRELELVLSQSPDSPYLEQAQHLFDQYFP